jgi:hypothetical protein
MHGIPYWGTESFSDIRDLVNLKIEALTLDKINDLCKNKGILIHVTDMYSLFLALSHLDFIFVIEQDGTWVSWCRDIRFNYRDRFLFIPYYKYKAENYTIKKHFKDMSKLDLVAENTLSIKYDFEIATMLLEERTTGFRLETITLYDYENKSKYSLSLRGITHFTPSTFSLGNLHDRYIASSYVASDLHDFFWEKYCRIDNKFKNNREHKLRKKMGLKAYSSVFSEIRYTDFRQYTYEELNLTSLVSNTDKPYWLRILEFEAYLYCIFASSATVLEEEYTVLFADLGVKSRFLSYVKNGKSLILKYYYKDTLMLRRKSFERYR